ncbi:MAG TPA: hypothetical protein VF175_10885 [Lacipirellula sp.]
MQAEKSGLAPAVIGGIIGAVIGVALDVVLEGGLLKTRYELSWFPVVIGVLTGLGVRLANRHHMERSYCRGAVSALIALAAIVASSFAVREAMARRDTSKELTAAAAKAEAPAEEADAEEAPAEDAEAAPAEPPPRAPAAGSAPAGVIGQPKAPGALNPWQFVFMALGALVAYELGRGPDPARRAAADEPRSEEPPLGGTDPSN